MPAVFKTIAIEPAAPNKPAFGAPCNGCGICCLSQPCPVGMVLSARRQGACVALRWDGSLTQYRCGAITQPREVLESCLPRWLRRASGLLAPLLGGLARRAVALDIGCDCDLQVQRPPGPGAQA